MDFILDIIILKKEIKNIKLNEKKIEWDGQFFSCEPPQYIAMTNIIFEQVNNMQYYNQIIGNELKDDVIVLNLKSDLLLDLEYDINSKNELFKNELLIFLMSLFDLSMFYILLIREDEMLKEKYEIQEQEQVASKICESLKWIDPKDVLLFKNSL